MQISSSTFQVDESGRVVLSGLGSGVDWRTTVENIITARRLPIDRLESRIETNAAKINGLQELNTLLGGLQDGLARLRGSVTFDGSGNVFNAKQAFASVSRTDGLAASPASSLIGVTVSNTAQVSSHDVEVLQTARTHKIASDSVASTGTALGFADGATFTIEGVTITVSSQDTLATLRDRINAANTGTNATGVSASIVTVSANQHYLVLNKTTAGSAIDISETGGTPLQTAGILTSGGAPKHELQSPRMAQLYADGLLDQSGKAYESARQPSASTTLGSSGTLRFDDGTTTHDLAYTSGQSLAALAANINADATLQGMGISASIVQEGAQARLKIVSSGNSFTMVETGGGSALADIGMAKARLLIERTSNTVNDLFAGITLSLFQAEVGTSIRIDVEQDLAAVKSEIVRFVDAYNAVKRFINQQTATDPATGRVSKDAILYGSPALTEVENRLSQIIGLGTAGVNPNFSVLAQIGVRFVNNATLIDQTLANTLTIDESVLDTALLNNPNDVKRLLSFDFSASDPRITMLGFNGKTTFNPAGYMLNVAFAERYDGTAFAAGPHALVHAVTGAPAAHGVSGIILDAGSPSGQALRYVYDAATETLTLLNLATGVSQSVVVTGLLDDAAGIGADLGPGQTVEVAFDGLGTVTLSGDDGFLRGQDIGAGTLDLASLHADTAMTGAAVTLAASGLGKATVDALVAAGAYDPVGGLLTLGLSSAGAGQASFDPAPGILFRVDGGAILSDISAIDLDDGAAHIIEIFVNDGTADVLVASLSFDSLSSAGAGTGSLAFDLGTGLFGSEDGDESATAPMSNYLSITDGAFEIRDAQGALITTVNYTAGESLADVAATIDAVAGLTAQVVTEGGQFHLRITSDASTPLAFAADTGGLLTALSISNTGSTIVSANVGGSADGADNGTVTISGGATLVMTAATGAEGLRLLYTGNTDASGIMLNFTTGVSSQLYFAVGDMLNETTGTVANQIKTLDDQNSFTEERVKVLLERLERQRQSLLDRFIRMETALTSMNALLDQIKQAFEVMNNNRK